MIKKTIKVFLALLIISSIFILSPLNPVNAADKSHDEKFTTKVDKKKQTFYARITYKQSQMKCSSVTFLDKNKKKLTGKTKTTVEKSSEGKKAKEKAQKWCRNLREKDEKAANTPATNTTGGGTDSGGGGDTGDGGGSTESKPVVVDTGPDNICDLSGVPESIKATSGCENTPEGKTLDDSITIILNNIILVSGLIAVVFIVVGGIQYMTSSGDATKVKKGKDTILYACIGLAICVLAFAIVNFVILNIIG